MRLLGRHASSSIAELVKLEYILCTMTYDQKKRKTRLKTLVNRIKLGGYPLKGCNSKKFQCVIFKLKKNRFSQYKMSSENITLFKLVRSPWSSFFSKLIAILGVCLGWNMPNSMLRFLMPFSYALGKLHLSCWLFQDGYLIFAN